MIFNAAGDSDDGGDATVDIGVGGGPAGNADAHGGAALPDSHGAPAGAFFLQLFDDAVGSFGVAERNEELVEDSVVQDLEAGGGHLNSKQAHRNSTA